MTVIVNERIEVLVTKYFYFKEYENTAHSDVEIHKKEGVGVVAGLTVFAIMK